MATLEIRRQLEALMGKEAMGGREDTRNWDDPQVCRMFLKGCCLHDLFTNTKKDMGPCQNVHMEKHRMQYEAAVAERGAPFPSVESEYENTVTQFVIDCDAKVKLYRRRLDQTQGQIPDDPLFIEKMKQINDYDTDITALTAEVERLGEAGQIDESMETLTKIEEIRAKKEEAEKALAESGADNLTQQHKLRVCDICSAYLSAFDSDRRLADHFGGRMHLGYLEVRNRAEEIQKKRAERQASLPSYESFKAEQEQRPSYGSRSGASGGGRGDRYDRDRPPPMSPSGGGAFAGSEGRRFDDGPPRRPYSRDGGNGYDSRDGPRGGYDSSRSFDQRGGRSQYPDDNRRRYRDDGPPRGGRPPPYEEGRGPRRDRSRSPRR